MHMSGTECANLGAQREFCLVSTLRNIHGFACWLIDSRIPLERTTFPYSAPRHAKAYGFMFRGPVSFEEAHAGFRFDAEYLKLPVRRDDRDLRQMLLRPLPLIVLQYRRDRLLSRRIRDLMRSRGSSLQNSDDLATVLNIAEFESDMICERVKSVLAAAKARRIMLGRRPGQRPGSDKLGPKVLALLAEGCSHLSLDRSRSGHQQEHGC